MRCGECRSEVDRELKYCNNCGNRVIRLSEAVSLFWALWFVVLFALVLLAVATSSLDALNRIPFVWGLICALDIILTFLVVRFYGPLSRGLNWLLLRP